MKQLVVYTLSDDCVDRGIDWSNFSDDDLVVVDRLDYFFGDDINILLLDHGYGDSDIYGAFVEEV